ncbi:hypothetical protein C8F04DRAFT_1193583 [Mycena alexandri]|uniref:Uncharacterized protein n=1 Tax=Mycena alexandri TaxID=1745969 RepID=A0AAD6WTV0_9AGAR|nr:hypothetical protein C8F04DRAFT_1193583 [Mycena alexandri]
MTAKPKRIKPTDAEVLDRRAQAAWEYRQRHRAAVNEKARLRMQKRREALKHASSDVQQQATQKARHTAKRYNETHRAPTTIKSPPTDCACREPAPTHRCSCPSPRPAPCPLSLPLFSGQTRRSEFGEAPGPPRGSIDRSSPPLHPTPQSRNHQQRTPKSLVAIDAEDSPGEETDEEKSDADEPAYTGHRITSIHRWWEYLDADGPLLNITGHPGLCARARAAAVHKGGRRYWF